VGLRHRSCCLLADDSYKWTYLDVYFSSSICLGLQDNYCKEVAAIVHNFEPH
jgi:hypothetical protein